MPQLNPQLVADIVRHRLGEEDASHSARYIMLIPEALKLTGRKIAANPNLRHLLMTDQAQATAVLDAGSAVDLDALYASDQILHEYLDAGEIYLENETYPLQWMTRSRAALPQYLSGSYRYCYKDGGKLIVKDGAPGDTVSFAVPKFPATLADLPESEEAQTLFLAKLIELIVGQDSAEDGAK